MENKILLNIFKALLTMLVVSAVIYALYGGIKAFTAGNYAVASPFISTIIVVVCLLAAIALGYYVIRQIWKVAPIILVAILFQACSYAKSNQRVVVSSDCGMTWKEIKAGDAIPSGMADPCFQKVVMPNYPMQELWLGWFGIIKKHRKKGIGSHALRFMEAFAKNLGCKALYSYVDSEGKPLAFYKNNGFEVIGTVAEFTKKSPNPGLDFECQEDIVIFKSLK